MHNDLSHRKILRQSDKSFIQFCIHKLEVKRSKLASGTTLKCEPKCHVNYAVHWRLTEKIPPKKIDNSNTENITWRLTSVTEYLTLTST